MSWHGLGYVATLSTGALLGAAGFTVVNQLFINTNVRSSTSPKMHSKSLTKNDFNTFKPSWQPMILQWHDEIALEFAI
jgi:hypothetical protein